MRNGKRLLISTSVLVMVIGAIFLVGWQQPAFGQTDEFATYQFHVFCKDAQIPAAIFPVQGTGSMGTSAVICVGSCNGRTVSITDAVAGLSAQVKTGLQAKVDKHQADAAAGKGWRLTCLGDKKPPEKKCEPNDVPPWFDPSSCRDKQKPQLLSWVNTFRLTMCGFKVFSWPKSRGILSPVPKNMLIDYKNSLPEVCCDRLREAARTGVPCDPRKDIDCDGEPNESDVRQGYKLSVNPSRVEPVKTSMPEINYENFVVPPSPKDDPIPYRAHPGNEEECECKWEFTKAIAKCKGWEGLYYEATWICPSTGLTIEIGKPSDPRVPCESPRSAQLLLFPDVHYTPAPWHFLNFLPEPQ